MRRAVVISLVCFFMGTGMAHWAVALSQAWTKHTIVVPAYGYFHKHGHCRTEDMVLVQRDYPDSIEFKCRHIDNI